MLVALSKTTFVNLNDIKEMFVEDNKIIIHTERYVHTATCASKEDALLYMKMFKEAYLSI